MGILESLGLSVLGICIVFIVLILLMGVIHVMAKTIGSKKTVSEVAPVSHPAVTEFKPAMPAPGSCGELTAFSVPDRIAAMVMAITADQLNVPLNELRFISIKEVN